jgi:tetratricopeptide (TPR) repeat protein
MQVAIGYGLGIAHGHGGCSPKHLSELQTVIQNARLAGSPLIGVCFFYYDHEAARHGAWKEVVETYRSVLLYIERFSPLAGESVACHAPLSLLHVSGSPAEAIELAERVLQRAKQRSRGFDEAAATGASAEPLLAGGDLRGAIRRLEASMHLAKKSMGYFLTREVFRLLPRLYLQENPRDKRAQRKAARVIEKGRRLVKKGHEDKRPLVELSEALLFEAQGKQAHADASFERALQTARSQGARFYAYEILLQRGLILKKRGDGANAKRDIDEARALAAACADKYVTQLCDEALGGL